MGPVPSGLWFAAGHLVLLHLDLFHAKRSPAHFLLRHHLSEFAGDRPLLLFALPQLHHCFPFDSRRWLAYAFIPSNFFRFCSAIWSIWAIRGPRLITSSLFSIRDRLHLLAASARAVED